MLETLNAARPIRHLARVCAAVAILSAPLRGENWPTWRGPVGNGASPEIKLPLAWNKVQGIRWSLPLPGWGASSPVVWGSDLYLTSERDGALLLVKVDTVRGQIAWLREVGRGTASPPGGTPRYLPDHNLASPSPVTNGELVVVHFGDGLLAAYDAEGELRWRRNLQEDHGSFTSRYGRASSPVLFGGAVISVCVQDARPNAEGRPAPAYVVAHELETGRLLWHTPRPTGARGEDGDGYLTPALALRGEDWQLIVSGGTRIDAYAPASGRLLWSMPDFVTGRIVASPTAAHGRVYVPLGERGPTLALELDRQGKRARDDHRWRIEEGTAGVASPAVWGDLVFLLSDNGVLRSFDAPTGKQRWRQQLAGEYRASPVTADSRVYLLARDGKCTVLSAVPERFDRLAVNAIDDEFLATPAISGGRLYLRGRKALYCVGRR